MPGVKELKNQLSRYLADVKDGKEVVVTERGRPIARLVPLEKKISRLEEMIDAGLVTPARAPRRRKLPPPVKPDGGTVSEFVIKDREWD